MKTLVIRDAQMEAFRESLARALHVRVAAVVRARCPDETANNSEASLVAFIGRELGRMRPYDIISESDCVRYLEFLFQHGSREPTPAVPEWAAAILQRRDLAGHQKLNLIDEHLLFDGRRPAS